MRNHNLEFHVLKINTHSTKSQGQGGSSKWHPDRLKTHTYENLHFIGTSALKIENAITKVP